MLKKIKYTLINPGKKVLSSKKINDYLNKRKYLKLYDYMTTNVDNFKREHNYNVYQKIFIKNFDIIKKNIEIRKEYLLYECKCQNEKINDEINDEISDEGIDNDTIDYSKLHHQLHIIYCFLIQNCCGENNTNENRQFIHKYMTYNT